MNCQPRAPLVVAVVVGGEGKILVDQVAEAQGVFLVGVHAQVSEEVIARSAARRCAPAAGAQIAPVVDPLTPHVMQTLKFTTNINCGSCIKAVTPTLNGEQAIQNWQVDTAKLDKILAVATDLSAEQVQALVRRPVGGAGNRPGSCCYGPAGARAVTTTGFVGRPTICLKSGRIPAVWTPCGFGAAWFPPLQVSPAPSPSLPTPLVAPLAADATNPEVAQLATFWGVVKQTG